MNKRTREDEVAEPESRLVGVKAAKAASKRKKSGKEEEMSQLQAIMEMKEKLYKQKILDRLVAKKDPLSEMEETLKLKLMSEMSSSRTCEPSHGCIVAKCFVVFLK
ncbi:hypothetical protein F2Q69_00036105 [Brassica cretica]|uniref:Uncharacterized protein n=1 Tax=Brassica cretica TaxID=69181 RepID=A0A8S9SIT7_BRACR|nr:hypothetical protein F2Q69_00036105 [Brassica cretica]